MRYCFWYDTHVPKICLPIENEKKKEKQKECIRNRGEYKREKIVKKRNCESMTKCRVHTLFMSYQILHFSCWFEVFPLFHFLWRQI